MSKIKNIEGLTVNDINRELERGAKFITYKYCVSIVILTFRRGSNIYFVRSGESGFKYGVGFSLITLLFGWWGIPWGPIYSIGALFTNLRGGKDVTQDIISSMNAYDE